MVASVVLSRRGGGSGARLGPRDGDAGAIGSAARHLRGDRRGLVVGPHRVDPPGRYRLRPGRSLAQGRRRPGLPRREAASVHAPASSRAPVTFFASVRARNRLSIPVHPLAPFRTSGRPSTSVRFSAFLRTPAALHASLPAGAFICRGRGRLRT
ncbi:hypothetical protein TNCT6_10690 [Streptomyces sp. 6-11-2]|nr:hypothetical protein TNCT6_10690 [Streptomyces sp. 6-11-2]